jgi:hypothetical protein
MISEVIVETMTVLATQFERMANMPAECLHNNSTNAR